MHTRSATMGVPGSPSLRALAVVLTVGAQAISCHPTMPGGLSSSNVSVTFGRPMQPDVRWLGVGPSITLSSLLKPIEMDTGDTIVRDGPCNDIPLDAWNARDDLLRDSHNHLVDPDTSAASIGNNVWVTGAQVDDGTQVAFVARSLAVSGALGIAYCPVSVSSSFGGSTHEVSMVIANTRRQVSLTDAARRCMRHNVCLAAASNGGVGHFITTAIYGNLIRLNVEGGTFQTQSSAGVGPAIRMSFAIDQEHVSIEGGLIGRVGARSFARTPQEVTAIYDISDVLRDLRHHDLLRTAEEIDRRSRSYGIVAVTVAEVHCGQDGGSTTPADGGS